MATQSERAERFRALHEREGAFVIPNPRDAGSARLRAGLGFEAAGDDVLYAPGLTTLDEVRQVSGAPTRPLNVLAPPLKGVAVAQLAEAGAKRISIGGRRHGPAARGEGDAEPRKFRLDFRP